MKHFLLALQLLLPVIGFAQWQGLVMSDAGPLEGAEVLYYPAGMRTYSDASGSFRIEHVRIDSLCVRAVGYDQKCVIPEDGTLIRVTLNLRSVDLSEAVVTGIISPVSLMKSAVRVEVISGAFLQSFPARSVTESLHFINGVQESLNCGVCGTNDIHLNGMEGPYTLVLIDGMPVMSALASVYGLNGIPDVLVDRIELIRGPSSTVFGSEAMGGVINIRTVRPGDRGGWLANMEYSNHDQFDAAVGWNGRLRGNHSLLVALTGGRNAFRMDFNEDGFTDIPLSERISGFVKWKYEGKVKASVAIRPIVEDRWGGEMNWEPHLKGSNSIYGESISTRRIELTSSVLFPGDWSVETSWASHGQDSYYGATHFQAEQHNGFSHISRVWKLKHHQMRIGTTQRLNFYKDNSFASSDERRWIPGVYVQEEWAPNSRWMILAGMRVDSHRAHGLVAAPQFNIRYNRGGGFTWRLNAGSGFRYVNLFTEDHAALSGSRQIEIEEELAPERSFTMSSDAVYLFPVGQHSVLTTSLNGFYTRFSNKILPDYLSDPDLIIYRNLNGIGTVRGFNADAQWSSENKIRIMGGVTWNEVFEREPDGTRTPQLFTPEWSGTGGVTFQFSKHIEASWTLRWFGMMQLPQFVAPFERPDQSQAFSLQHVQFKYTIRQGFHFLIAIKNVGNFTQPTPLINPDQPFSEAFDTSYVYGPLQPRHGVIGVSWTQRSKVAKTP